MEGGKTMEKKTKSRLMSPSDAYQALKRSENFSSEWSDEIDEVAIESALVTLRVYPQEFQKIIHEETKAYRAKISDALSSVTSGKIDSNEQIKKALEEVEKPGFLSLVRVPVRFLNPKLRRFLGLELDAVHAIDLLNHRQIRYPSIVGSDLAEVLELKDMVGDGYQIPINIGREGFEHLRQQFESGEIGKETPYTLKLIFSDTDVASDLYQRIEDAQRNLVQGRSDLDLVYNSKTLDLIEEKGLLEKIKIPTRRKQDLEGFVGENDYGEVVAIIPDQKIAFVLADQVDYKLLKLFLYAPEAGRPAGSATLTIFDSGEIEGISTMLSGGREPNKDFEVIRTDYSYSVGFREATPVFNINTVWEELSQRKVDYRKQPVFCHTLSEEDLVQRVKEVAKEKREELARQYHRIILEPMTPVIDFAMSYQFEKEAS